MLKLLLVLVLIAGTHSQSSTNIPTSVDDYKGNQGTKKIDTGVNQRHTSLPIPSYPYPTYPKYDFPRPEIQPVSTHPASSGWSSTIASGLVPLGSFALTYGARSVVLIFQFFVLLLVGVVLTTSICTFTPFCTITFDGFAITKNQVREQVSELARAYITPESLNLATVLVKTAVETYAEMQRQDKSLEEGKKIFEEKPTQKQQRRRR